MNNNIEQVKIQYLDSMNKINHVIAINRIIKHFNLAYDDYRNYLDEIRRIYDKDKSIIHSESRTLKLEKLVSHYFASILSVIDHLVHLKNKKKIKDCTATKLVCNLKKKNDYFFVFANQIRNFLIHDNIPKFGFMPIVLNKKLTHFKSVIDYASLVDYKYESAIKDKYFQKDCWKYYLDNSIFIFECLSTNDDICNAETIQPYRSDLIERLRKINSDKEKTEEKNSTFFKKLISRKDFVLCKYEAAEIKDFQFYFDIDKLIHHLFDHYQSLFNSIYSHIYTSEKSLIDHFESLSDSLYQDKELPVKINLDINYN